MRDAGLFASTCIVASALWFSGCGKSSSSAGSEDAGGAADSGADGSAWLPDSGATEAAGAMVDVSITKNVDGPSGCGLAGAPTGVLANQTITVGEQVRTYVLSVPKSYDPGTPLALVFGWHGHGGTGNQARQSFVIEPAAAGGAIFVYPNGVTGSSAGMGWDLSPTGIDVALFDALVANLAGSYCIDRNRIFSTGMSNGAFFTNVLGCYRGDVLRAIAPVAGAPPGLSGPDAVTCTSHVGAWVAHASNDDEVDFTTGGVATRDFWLSRNGCSTALAPVTVGPSDCVEYQGCRPDLPVIWCVYSEGHTWPSMTNCYDGGVCFDAGPAVWSFFARFK